jgi:hypothetical protein
MSEKFGMPTKEKVTSGAMGLAVGAGGGVLVRLLTNLTGSSTIGQVAAAVLGLSFLPEKEGHTLATVIGYQLGQNLNIGSFGFGSKSTQSTVEIG